MTRVPVRIPALALVLLLAAGCGGGSVQTILSTVGEEITPAPASAAPSPGSGDCPTSEPAPLGADQVRDVSVETELGTFVITVEGGLSPIAAGNFVALAECGYYDGVGFHRVVPGFVIQGGDPTGTGGGDPGYKIRDEPVTATYERGVVAMARTRQPNSQGSQFFVVLDDSARTALQGANTYAIFGHVTAGMEVVDAIAAAADGENPSDPVLMTHVFVGKR